MKHHTYIVCLLVSCLSVAPLWGQKEARDVRQGNKQYKKEKYTEAEVAYRKGLETNNQSFEGRFNLGDALFRQEKYPEALEQYQAAEALVSAEDKAKLAAVNHNIGNAHFAQQQYAEAIKAYKKALKNAPQDDETRYNLAYATEMLKQQQQNQQQQGQDKQQQESQQEQKQQPQEKQQQEDRQEQQQMSKENAERILEALAQDEQETQEKAQKAQYKGTRKAEKDW